MKVISNVKLHLRAGYVLALALAPFILFSALALDIYRLSSHGADPRAALTLDFQWKWVISGFFVSLTLVVLVPILLAPWVAHSRGRRSLTAALRIQNKYWTISYIVLSLLAGYCVIYAHNLEILSGPRFVHTGNAGDLRLDMASVYLLIQKNLPGILWAIVGLLSIGIGFSSVILQIPKPISIQEYLNRLKYQVLPSEFLPVHGQKLLNLNAGGLAPLLEGIDKSSRVQMKKYQSLVPGTAQARKHLEEQWDQCKILLKSFGVVQPAGKQVRLTASTSRALDIALLESPPDSWILFSPYEHPTEHIVAQLHKRKIDSITVDSGFYESTWEEQKTILVKEIMVRIKDRPRTHGVFIISEVCWATGLVIPIVELAEEIDKAIASSGFSTSRRPRLIVDGAHAVGNIPEPKSIDIADAYIFCGHKWLMSPEPCGVLLSNRAQHAYDVWVDRLPETSTGASYICGFYSALKLLDSFGQDTRMERSMALKDKLLRMVDQKLDLVGKETTLPVTDLISLKPAANHQWKRPKELGTYLRNHNINVLVIEDNKYVGQSQAWVRVSIPYFLDWRAINLFGRYLSLAVEKIQ